MGAWRSELHGKNRNLKPKALQVPGVQPMCTIDDALEAEAIILNDPVVAKLVKQRYGITDVKTQLVADPWYYGARTGDLFWDPFLC